MSEPQHDYFYADPPEADQLFPGNQNDWNAIIDDSAYSLDWIADKFGFRLATLKKWLIIETPDYPSRKRSTPNEQNFARMVKAMTTVKAGERRLEKHPSYGYATEAQIKRLNEIGLGPERDKILKEIDKQTKSMGKVR